MSRIIITGTRHATDADRALVWHLLDGVREDARAALGHRLAPITRVMHGAGLGVDQLADEWAHARGLPRDPHPADWRRYGRPAGPIRNTAMAHLGADLCVALPLAGEPDEWGGRQWSSGTDDMILAAGNRAIPTLVYELQRGPRGRLRVVGASVLAM